MAETKTNKILPAQLQNTSFGFVKLRKKSKKPIEKDWQKKPYTHDSIQLWIDQGGNYGVQGGYGGLIIIDADTPEIDEIVKSKLLPTFTVKTPRCGHHYYYICEGIDKKIVLNKGDDHYGEIISTGAQVVGPGSIHPDTGTEYEVIKGGEIKEISKEDIFTNLAEYLPSKGKGDSVFNELTQKYGEPYYFKTIKRGNKDVEIITGINESFWAGLHNAEHIELYEPTEKSFYKYDDLSGLYKEESPEIIKQDISKRILEESRRINSEELERKRTYTCLNKIVGHLKGIGEKRDAFDRNKRKIVHLADGVLKFKDNDEADLVSFSPEFYSRNQSPILFDETAQCPRFLNELLLPATSPDDAILIQKYMGLCLLGNNLIQRLLILDGAAGRGKSTISLIIQGLVGLKNVTELRTRHLDGRFELYRYLKKTMLIGVDVPGDFLSQKGAVVLKGLVGADWMDAEQKCGTGSFQLQGNYCVVITSNSKLQVRLDGDIGAWRRRLLIVRFEGPVPEKKIRDFAGKLIEEEGSGILNLALEGLKMVLEDDREHGDIQLTEAQSGVVDALLEESDSLRHFLSDCVVNDENGDLSANEIIESYAEYCPNKKWNPKPITIIRKELDGLMLELFQTTKANSICRENKDVRGFRRVKLKQ